MRAMHGMPICQICALMLINALQCYLSDEMLPCLLRAAKCSMVSNMMRRLSAHYTFCTCSSGCCARAVITPPICLALLQLLERCVEVTLHRAT